MPYEAGWNVFRRYIQEIWFELQCIWNSKSNIMIIIMIVAAWDYRIELVLVLVSDAYILFSPV